jgi:hypothetical protein
MKRFARTVQALALAVVVLPAWPAFAEQPHGFYVGVGAGNAEADVSAGDMNELFREAFANRAATFTPQTSSIDSKDSSLYVFAGYRIFPYLSAEGGYIDLGSIDYASRGTLSSFGSGVRQITNRMEIDSKGVAASALGNLPLGDYFEFHGRVGFFVVNTDATFTGGSSGQLIDVSESGISVSVQLGLGAAVNLGNHFSLSADWIHYFAVDNGGGDEDEDLDYDGYDVDVLRLSAIVRF